MLTLSAWPASKVSPALNLHHPTHKTKSTDLLNASFKPWPWTRITNELMLGWWVLTWQVSLNPTELTQCSWTRWCCRSDRQTYPVLGVFTMVWGIQSSFLAREASRGSSRMCFSVFNTGSFQKKPFLVQEPSLYTTLAACSQPCLVQMRASMWLCIQLLYVVGLTFSVAIQFTLCSVNVCDNKGKMGKGG